MTRIAIIGLAASYGACRTLEAFARTIYAGQPLSPDELSEAEKASSAPSVSQTALADAGLSKDWRVASLTPSSAETVGQALVEAEQCLATRQADAVVLTAVDAAGAGAVVLGRADEIPADHIYAVLEEVSVGAEPRAVCQQAWRAAGLTSADIGYLEAVGLPSAAELEAYRASDSNVALTCALSSGAQSAMAALIKAALCLHRRTLPPLPGWEGPAHPEHWHDTPFFVAPQARPWFGTPETKRRAVVSAPEGTGGAAYFILAEPTRERAAPLVCPQPGKTAFYLFPMAAEGREALLAQLAGLQTRLAEGTSLEALAYETYVTYQRKAGAAYALALAGHDPAELEREIKFALEGVPAAFETGKPWTSPRGSYFTAQPLGPKGLTFVYPGAFNAYVGLGCDLFQHFPRLHERLAEMVADVGSGVIERSLYPRRLAPFAEAEAGALGEQLAADPAGMIEAGILFAMGFTWLLRDVFGVQPRAALGYSLGEVSMLWAGGVWSNGEAGSAAWRKSPLFKTRLFGPKEAVREAWRLPAGGDDFWHTYLLKAPAAKVQACLANEPRLYLTMINLPDEVVIAGEPEACRRAILALDCRHALRVPFDSVLHNTAMRSEAPALAELYTYPVHSVEEVTFYSAARYAPLTLEQSALARDLADMTCSPLDFPRLVNVAYAGGARLFVEVGPQGTCTRWIERILRGREHAALPINRPRSGDYEGVLSALAMLLSHRVSLNLAPLYAGHEEPRASTPALFASEIWPAEAGTQAVSEYAEHLGRQAARLAESHRAFLQTRQAMLESTAELIQLQTSVSQAMLGLAPSAPTPSTIRPPASRFTPHVSRFTPHASSLTPPLFAEAAIQAFADGNPEACFGATYAIYRGRRLPRLPNGDLLFVNRITAIEGVPGRVAAGATLAAEFDVPADAWFLSGGFALPYTALMEIALQPCGFLSAYLGSTLPYPEMDFYFRNLDGQGQLLREADVRGRTITNRVRLVSATTLLPILLQKFEFELACEGEPFYRGQSSFGYFSREALENQAGLGGEALLPARLQPNQAETWVRAEAGLLPPSQLDLLDEMWVSPTGGQHGHGCVYAETHVRPDDWFFKCHFFQDPVMPGSLGVEAIRQAMQIFGLQANPGLALRACPAPGPQMVWKYRGQVRPDDSLVRLEAHLTGTAASDEGLILLGDASVWKGDVRVYEIKQMGVKLWN